MATTPSETSGLGTAPLGTGASSVAHQPPGMGLVPDGKVAMRATVDRAGALPRGTRTATAVAASALVVIAALGGAAGRAGAAPSTDEDPRGGVDAPSRADVEQARERARGAAGEADLIRRQLQAALVAQDAAYVAAGRAAERANGARWRLEQAERALRAARERQRLAAGQATRQRDRLAGLVAAAYQQGTGLTTLSATLTATVGSATPESLMGETLALDGAADSLNAQGRRWSASAALAEAFAAEADRTADRRRTLLARAERAGLRAEAAARAATAHAADLEARRRALVARLARLEGISLRLAERRQAALDAAERRAAQEATQETAQETAQQPEPNSPAPVTPDPVTPDPVTPDPVAPDPTPPAPAAGVGAVLAFARAQLGEPYRWGAAGPDAWDCSGLTSGAWARAGVTLPHYSVAQYAATTPISRADLRPGDLVFWGSRPADIHHVALYLGGGQILHAPRTGRPVSVDAIDYWVPPLFFGRVRR